MSVGVRSRNPDIFQIPPKNPSEAPPIVACTHDANPVLNLTEGGGLPAVADPSEACFYWNSSGIPLIPVGSQGFALIPIGSVGLRRFSLNHEDGEEAGGRRRRKQEGSEQEEGISTTG